MAPHRAARPPAPGHRPLDSSSAAVVADLLDALRGLSWPARRRSRGLTPGTHPARLAGASPEFSEYRAYRQGEDPRRLDWKLLARTDRAYLRVTNDRALLGTSVVVDASASMAFPAATHAKWQHARAVAVGLLAVAHAAGDPVGLLVPVPGGLRRLTPRTRRGTVGEAVGLLAAVEPAGAEPLAPALVHVPAAHRVVVIADFLGDADALLAAGARRARAGAEVHAVHVVAAAELEPDGAMLAVDPEDPATRRMLGAHTLTPYRAAFDAWRAELADRWRAAGATYTEVLAPSPADRAVRNVVRPPEAGR